LSIRKTYRELYIDIVDCVLRPAGWSYAWTDDMATCLFEVLTPSQLPAFKVIYKQATVLLFLYVQKTYEIVLKTENIGW